MRIRVEGPRRRRKKNHVLTGRTVSESPQICVIKETDLIEEGTPSPVSRGRHTFPVFRSGLTKVGFYPFCHPVY